MYTDERCLRFTDNLLALVLFFYNDEYYYCCHVSSN